MLSKYLITSSVCFLNPNPLKEWMPFTTLLALCFMEVGWRQSEKTSLPSTSQTHTTPEQLSSYTTGCHDSRSTQSPANALLEAPAACVTCAHMQCLCVSTGKLMETEIRHCISHCIICSVWSCLKCLDNNFSSSYSNP